MKDRVAVIGAGLTGLVVAERLADAGRIVTVFDKSRGLGGRLATRRNAFGEFDHGAPVIHCERAPLERLMVAGACAPWADHGHVGLPGMSGLVQPLATGLEIRRATEIATLHPEGRQIWLEDTPGARHGPYAQVVVAIPAPQARRLVAGLAVDAALAAVAAAPVWTLMAAFAERPDLPDVLRPGGAVDLVLRNGAKPGRAGENWILHAGHDWTRARLEDAKETVLPALLGELRDLAEGRLPDPLHVEAHRWRYALTERPLGAPFLSDLDGSLFVGGDWTLGARAEHAWLSAQAMADAILG